MNWASFEAITNICLLPRPPPRSLWAGQGSTWSESFSSPTPPALAPSSSSTWGRSARGCGCRPGSTSSSPPPSSRTKRPTSASGSSRRSPPTRSELHGKWDEGGEGGFENGTKSSVRCRQKEKPILLYLLQAGIRWLSVITCHLTLMQYVGWLHS